MLSVEHKLQLNLCTKVHPPPKKKEAKNKQTKTVHLNTMNTVLNQRQVYDPLQIVKHHSF